MATVATSPNDLTRQQLDELDSLLQRMLSLPLNPPESFIAAAPVPAYAPPMPYPTPSPVAREAPMPVAAPRAFAPPAPEPAELSVPWKSVPAPVYGPRLAPALASVQPAQVIELPVPKTVKPAPVPIVATTPAPIASRSEPVPFLFAPLVGLNAVLNGALGLFGLPGRFLRSGFVKSLFGLAGFGLLAYTVLKVAQIHGWIALPEQLPWPR